MLPVECRSAAEALFELGREVHAVQVPGRVSICVRASLPTPGHNPVTLFVITHRRGGEIYTYWFPHWPRPYRSLSSRYAKHLKVTLGRAVIGHQAARHVPLLAVGSHLKELQRIVRETVRGIERHGRNFVSRAALDETVAGLEGEQRRAMIRHRKRESRLLPAKIAEALQQNDGRLP